MTPLYTVKDENSAGRLWNIMTAAQNLNGATTHTQLSKAFGIEGNDGIDLLRALVATVETLDDIDARIKRIKMRDHDLFVHSIPHLKQGFLRAASDQDFNQWKNTYLKPEFLDPLMYCANKLSETYDEQDIKKEELDAFAKRVDDLHTSVKASTLDGRVKDRILESLENIRRAISEYRIRGIAALRRSLSTATGELVLHRAEFEKAKNEPEVKNLMEILSALYVMTLLATKQQTSLPAYIPFSLDTAKESR
jgi:hypothetical protein